MYSDKKLKKLVILILSIIIILNFLYVFEYKQYAVVRQFGRIVRVEKNGGIKFKIPIIENVEILPMNRLFYDVPPAEVTTLDKKRINVDYYITWEIKDPVKMLENLKTIKSAEARLGDILYSAIRNELGKLEYGSIINPEDNNRGNIDDIVKREINKNLMENETGIIIADIQMKKIDLPESNEQAVYKRMISERDSKAQEYLSQGEAEKIKIISETDKKVTQELAITEAKAKEIIAEGVKEAQRIKNESFSRSPEFFKVYKTLESYKKVIKDETVIILPINSPYLEYLKGIN